MQQEKRMKPTTKMWLSIVAVMGLMVGVVSADNRVITPGQVFMGKSYNELVDEWTNWLVIEPSETNPANDSTGGDCNKNQKGKVWFLASTFGGVEDRACTVPAGKAIFIGLGGVFLSFSPDFPGTDAPCLALPTALEIVRCDVNNDIPVAPDISFEVEIDGVAVEDLFASRAQSPPGGFTLRVPNPSLLTDLGFAPGDRSPAVADGYFLFVKPLPPGVHTINFIMNFSDGSEGRGVNYTLTVSP
jgi:hypothetical protein